MMIKKFQEKSGTVLNRVKRTARRMAGVALAGLVVVSGTGIVKAANLADIFDAKQYAENYADLKKAFGDDEKALLKHYLTYGIAEGRETGGLLDVVKYRQAYPDLDAAFGDNWDAYVDHYLTYGVYEKRDNFTDFDALDYMERYGDLKEAFGDDVLALYQHYQTYGKEENREARSETVVVAEKKAAEEAVRKAAEEAARKEAEEEAKEEEVPAEETYDFGGAVVRVSGGHFYRLSDSSASDWEIARQIEDKYNIKLVFTEPEVDDGWYTNETILNGFASGEAYADIFCQGNVELVWLKDYLEDITSEVDQLQIGSINKDAGTLVGHTYGWTYDNMGIGYVMVYSRDYLASIGMDKTPTDMFEAGQWSYSDAIEYLTELKSKLPEGTYPISTHTNHWVAMAPAANGVVSVDSNGGINLDNPAYCSALDFYKQLLELGLAYPITDVFIDEESGGIGSTQTYSLDTLSRVGDPGTHVITLAEAWQLDGLYDLLGEWGIVPWPWDPAYVSASGNYTTLSDGYKVAQSNWSDVMVPKAEYRSDDAKNIPGIVLHMIAKDFIELCGNRVPDSFCTDQDAAIYKWLPSRVVCDWGNAMNANGYVMVNRNAAYVIANGDDSKTSGASFKASGEAAMKEAGLK